MSCHPVQRHDETAGTDVYATEVHGTRFTVQSAPYELNEHRIIRRFGRDGGYSSGRNLGSVVIRR